jgi:hypothetical protein
MSSLITGAAFAVYALMLAIYGVISGVTLLLIDSETWQHFAYCGVIELAAIAFALLSLRDR